VKILITFAVEAEFAAWRKLRHFELIQMEASALYRAQIGPATVDCIVTGMGPENAGRAADIVMRAAKLAPYDLCIASGFSAALKAEQNAGDILVARAVQRLGNSATIECSQKLFESAIECGAAPTNLLLSTDKVVSTAEDKKRLGLFADAVDMESFVVLSAAQTHALPAIAIRAITDRLDENMPANIDTTVDQKGQVRLRAVASYVSRHPLQVPAMIRLGRNSRMTAATLAQYLETYIKKLSSETDSCAAAELLEISAT
jgi:adenosylhomocysteine nucleosidase